MTDDTGVICRRCGFTNVAGDQFCGSCGAFLEWEGEAADAAGSPAAPATAADGLAGDGEGLSGLVRPAAATPTPQPASPGMPTPQPASPPPVTQGASDPAAPSSDALLRCPDCGIANAGTRTFCQSCGARLADTARVTNVSKEQIAAAVAVTTKPKAVPAAGVKTARTEPGDGSKRGIAGWLIVMALLGIVAGVLVVAASVVLKSPGPATGASEAPSIAASAGPDASGGASTGPAPTDALVTSEAPAAVSPTAKVDGVVLELTGAAASSVVGNLAKFQPDKAIDGDVKTCWQEGAKVEKGQWIEVSFAASRVDVLIVNNGYGASTALYKGNLRPKKVEISIDGGKASVVTLKDTAKAQRISLGEHPGATRLRITIVSVYGSVKTPVAGTPFDDAAISEIGVIGLVGG